MFTCLEMSSGGVAGGVDMGNGVEVTVDILKDVSKLMDEVHITGKEVVSKMSRAHLNRFGVAMHQTNFSRMMNIVGLKWSTIKSLAKAYTTKMY